MSLSAAHTWPKHPQKASKNVFAWKKDFCSYAKLTRVTLYCWLWPLSLGCHGLCDGVCVCVCIWRLVRKLRGFCCRERERKRKRVREREQSGPQAELLIGLVRVQGYRWVTKPPLITNHFCHESRSERKSSKVCIKQRKLIGRAHFSSKDVFALSGPGYFAFRPLSFLIIQVLFN